MTDILSNLPSARRDGVARVLTSAFGALPDRAPTPVLGGASGALAFRIDYGARRYLLRLERESAQARNPAQNQCLEIAARAGVAPPLQLADESLGLVVMDFIETQPLASFPGGPAALAQAAGALIGRLQATEGFPSSFGFRELLTRMLAHLEGQVFAPGLLGAHRAALEQITAAYPWDRALRVASHNDPNPRNILFDGQRLWLVDWETAYASEPLVDLAVMTHELAPTPELEAALIAGWRGEPDTPALRARLALVRTLTHLYYAGLIFAVGALPGAALEASTDAPDMATFYADLTAGRLSMSQPSGWRTFGKISLANFLAGTQGAAFETALRRAAEG